MILGALQAIGGGEIDSSAVEISSELALAAIKNITQNAKVVVDLHSAVYMFHFTQAAIKHVSDKEAYNVHVGRC